MKSELEKYGIQMPTFSKIGGILANELSVDEAACKRGRGLLFYLHPKLIQLSNKELFRQHSEPHPML